MFEARNVSFAPDYNPKSQEWAAIKANIAHTQLYVNYSLTHQSNRKDEMMKFNDGNIWKGPDRFASTAKYTYHRIPNERVAQSIEDALFSICSWPNARGQALQLKQCVKFGARAGLYEEVASIGGLVSKIAREKPYGEKTIGQRLISNNWEYISMHSNPAEMRKRFALIIKRLSDFAEGKYKHCLNDYPNVPFHHLKEIDNLPPSASLTDITQLRENAIKKYYPALQNPDLSKKLGIPTY